MEQFVLIPYSVYQPQNTLPRKQKLEQKQEKEEIVPKKFDSIYSAVNARLKTSNNKNIIDLILNSPRNKISQSDNIILDNRDTKESILDFRYKNKIRRNLKGIQVPPNLVINKNAKAKDRGTWIPFKI